MERFKLNDILVSSWGYDQTNIDFYKVVGLTSKCVKIRKLKQTTTETGFMCGDTTPLNEFANDKILTKRIMYYKDKPYISISYGSADLWEGKPERCSWYA